MDDETIDPNKKRQRQLKHSRTGYVRGCRCDVCCESNREYQRKYMKQWREERKTEEEKTSV